MFHSRNRTKRARDSVKGKRGRILSTKPRRTRSQKIKYKKTSTRKKLHKYSPVQTRRAHTLQAAPPSVATTKKLLKKSLRHFSKGRYITAAGHATAAVASLLSLLPLATHPNVPNRHLISKKTDRTSGPLGAGAQGLIEWGYGAPVIRRTNYTRRKGQMRRKQGQKKGKKKRGHTRRVSKGK